MSDLALGPGDLYGPYRIRSVLGEGAFARVFEVEAPGIADRAALKVSRQAVGGSDEAQRSLREIAILGALTSNHVVRIFDSGFGEDRRVFILMEFLDGQQLDRFHDFDAPMPAAQALWLVHQACLGLAEAHAHGIVHRDVKPENVWVEQDHNVKVIDFGLARAWDVATTIGHNVTMGRFLIGTPRYMQPEQLQTGKLSPASDVYSLATILYELVTGHTVFFPDEPLSVVRERLRDDPIPWIQAHARETPVPITHYPEGRELPAELTELVHACLAKDPAHRPPDAGRLSLKLGEVLHYEFGAVMAATLRVVLPWGGYDELLLLPGSHRIGSGAHCEVRLPSSDVRRVHAILEWGGLPELPHLRPLVGDGSVQVNGAPIQRRARLGADDRIQIGSCAIELRYPSV